MTQNSKVRNQVLIADDDPLSRRMLEAFLAKSGYRVVTAVDGVDALRILSAEDSPPLAILDWMMPGLEGPQVCERVRALPERAYVYILLLTARNDKQDLLNGLQSGADDYLTKPFDAQELRARLHVGQRILDLQDSLIAAREEMRFHATHDLLTGIDNRSVAIDAMNRESSRQARDGGSFGVVLLDLDHFKNVNDTLGHLAGDAVLKESARRMKLAVRPYDTVGRYGGEEFLVVAPSSNGDGTLVLAERIREAIQSTLVTTQAGEVRVTASCGVAASTESNRLDTHTLLRLADEALYRAKQRGRNRSELAAYESAIAPALAPDAAPVKSL
ncbi:MAG TPA: diguanylate cyclase [Verrucomicrobiae bacterium]|nr:diguanylate cyclase [Verrucomicrobiae bacterium]